MKHFRKVIFYTFLVSTISITAFAFWFFSGQPNEEQIAKAFPLNSYKIFSNGRKLTLYSIESNKKSNDAKNFQGYSIIGKTEIHDRSFQKLLKKAFLNDISKTSQKSKCYKPRHGLRIFDKERIIDLVICYESKSFVVIFEDSKIDGVMNQNSKALLNKTLTDAGINIIE